MRKGGRRRRLTGGRSVSFSEWQLWPHVGQCAFPHPRPQNSTPTFKIYIPSSFPPPVRFPPSRFLLLLLLFPTLSNFLLLLLLTLTRIWWQHIWFISSDIGRNIAGVRGWRRRRPSSVESFGVRRNAPQKCGLRCVPIPLGGNSKLDWNTRRASSPSADSLARAAFGNEGIRSVGRRRRRR